MDSTFLTDRINKTKEMIIALEDAFIQLSNGTIESYTLDTGQSVQKVTNQNIREISKTVDSLYNRLVTLEARLTGNGVNIGMPAW